MNHQHGWQSTVLAQSFFAGPFLLVGKALALAGILLWVDVMARTNVNLVWEPVSDPRVAFYKVYWGTQSGQYQSSQQVASTSTTIEGLEEGETYFFAAKACDQAGEFCSDFSEELSTTIDYSPPVANFSESKTSGVGSLTVTFDDSSEGKIDSYRWDFGDGNSSSAATAVHTYGSTGSYTVSLTVTGPGGTATKTKTDLIRVSASDSGDDTGPGPGDDSIADAEFVTNPIGGGAELPIEAGEITLDHEWKRVNFARAFIDPVVVSTSVSGNDDDPVTVRIAAVDQSGFFIRLQEWEYLDDQHVAETVGYLVVERGSHQLPNGAWLEADDIPVGSGDSWQVGSFIAPFATSPIVLSSVATYNDASAVVTRLRNISSTGFAMMMQGSEANGIAHATEMVSYVAWEASCGEINGYQFTVGKTADAVTHSPVYLGFTDQCDNAMTFTAPPVLLTDMQTTDGGDTANLRWDSKGNLSARVWVDEEQSRDGEVGHTTEVVGYLAIGETDSPTF